MISIICRLGRQVLGLQQALGATLYLLFIILRYFFVNILRFRLIIKEIYFFGVLALGIIMACGVFLGLILGLQAYRSLLIFHAESSLGAVVGISILREIGPVLAAILFASSTGSAITSEIALMKTTDQLNALQVMGVDPIERILGSRFWAGVYSLPLLTMVFNMCAIWGTYLIAIGLYDLDRVIFWGQMQKVISVSFDIKTSIIKSVAFAFAISLIAVYNGIKAKSTPSGMLQATNHTVVVSSIVILAIDLMLTVLLLPG